MNQVIHSWPALRIDVTANGYAVRELDDPCNDRYQTIANTHVFESFEGVVAYLRNRLPIYPVMQPTMTTTARPPRTR